MRVEVNLTKYPPLIAEKMHLNDPNCKATDLNETFAVFDIPIDGCGTHGDGSNPEYLLFSNAVHWTPEASEGVLQTRVKGYIAHISCRYPTHGKASAHIKLKESGKILILVYYLLIKVLKPKQLTSTDITVVSKARNDKGFSYLHPLRPDASRS